jgi:SEC-C motif
MTETRPRPGRNDPCPCGSGRKFKRCCGVEHVMTLEDMRANQTEARSGGLGESSLIHTQVFIEDDTRSAWVDEGMASLILECWRHGIDTVGSCQTTEFIDVPIVGVATILFATEADADRYESLTGDMIRLEEVGLRVDRSEIGGCVVGFVRDIDAALRILTDAPCLPPTFPENADGRMAHYSTRAGGD